MNIPRISLPVFGVPISKLALGTWHGTGHDTFHADRLEQVINTALDLGINMFDTAPVYADGASERVLGATLRGQRDKVIIATKFWFSQSSPDKIRRSLEASLQRLGTDYVDILQQHWPPNSTPLPETINELLRLKEEGKIRAVGVCNWMEPEWAELPAPSEVNTLQPCYNLLWRTIESNVLPLCQNHHIAIFPYSPLAQGLLGGRAPTSESLSQSRSQNKLFGEALVGQIQEVLAVVRAIAVKHGVSCAQVALQWLLQNPAVTAPIVGASTPEQLRDLVAVFDWSLSPEEVLELNTISSAFQSVATAHESMWGFHPRSGRR